MATLKSIKNKYLTSSDGTVLGVSTNTENISLLSFKLATADSLSKFNLVDGFADDFNDDTGVDSTESTDEVRNSDGNYFAGTDAANYFGDGSLGNCTFGASSITQTSNSIDIDTVLSTGSAAGGPGTSSYGTSPSNAGASNVPNPTACYETTILSTSGSYDGDMWVGNFKDLTIDSSVTLTTNRPCRGIFLYATGNVVINGTLSMTSRGAAANPTSSGGSDSNAVAANGLQLGMRTTGGSSSFTNDGSAFAGCGTTVKTAIANQGDISSNGDIFTVVRAGGAGGDSTPGGGRVVGGAGGAGGTVSGSITLGGGGGGARNNWDQANSVGGYDGGIGGCFGGGSGGGGESSSSNSLTSTGSVGASYGGTGGNGARGAHGDARSGGGGGNAGGTGRQGTKCCGYNGDAGTGGMIWLIVQGNLTVGGSATIEAKGRQGGSATGAYLEGAGGGGTGGGAVQVMYAGALSNTGTVSAAGGSGGSGKWTAYGGVGGDGGTSVVQVLGLLYNDMILESEPFTAQTAPSTARVIIDEFTPVGTCTVNTDIKAYASRDNGTTFTQITGLAEQSVISTEGGIDTYTKLMLHMDGANAGTTFTDSSDAPHTVTAVGGAQTLTAQRRFGTASGYFDGTGDYLTLDVSADWNFGTADFTIDGWISTDTSPPTYGVIFDSRDATATETGFALAVGSGGDIYIYSNGMLVQSSNSTIAAETWYHVALVRASATTKIYVNGVSVGSSATVRTYSNTTARIGIEAYGTSEAFKGYIDEFRISKGIARYTADFTPPTQAYSAGELANRRLLSGSLDISGQPSGTSMKYQIKTLNQSTTKQTRLYGASMAWAT